MSDRPTSFARIPRRVTALLLVASLGLAAHASSPAASDRVVIFGTGPRLPVAADGTPSRYDAEAYSQELCALVAQAAHIKYRIVEKPTWAELLKAFESGEIDVLPALARLPEREKTMLFSVPHLRSALGIFARRGGPTAFSLADLKGKRIATMRDSVGDYFLRQHGLADNALLSASVSEIMHDVVAGRADFAIQNQIVGSSVIYSEKLDGRLYLALPLTERSIEYCLAVRPDDVLLLASLNDGLFVLQERRTLNKLYEKWFADVAAFSISTELVTRWAVRGVAVVMLFSLVGWGWHRIRLRREQRRSAEIARLVEARTRELTESRARYQALFEDSAIPLWEHDLSELKRWIESLQREGTGDFTAYVHSHPDELRACLQRTRVLDVNRACSEYYEATDLESLREHLKVTLMEDGGTAFATELPALFSAAHQCRLEKPARTLQGGRRYIAKVMKVLPGAESTFDRVLVSGMDITARVEAERQLRDSAELSRLVLAATNDGVWDWDLVTDRIAYSARWHEMLGYQIGELTAKSDSWQGSLHADDRAAFCDLLSRHLKSGSPFAHTARWLHKDGSYRWFISRVQAVRDASGRPVRVVAGHADITDLRRMDTELVQSRKLRSLGEMVGGIAHEFNNLLSPMMLQTEVICQDRASDHELHEQLRLILSSVKEAKELTERILMFGRRAEVRRDIVELSSVLQDNLELVHHTTDRRIAITLHVNGAIPPLWLNRSDLNQVVLNLVLNARDTLMEKLIANSGGEWAPTIRLEVARVQRPSGAPGIALPAENALWQCVSVRDNGMGLAPAHRDRIFEPFFTTKEHGVGTGLGLATVWHLMIGMGGWVEVESEPGAGSVFRVFIPETPVPAEILNPAAAARPAESDGAKSAGAPTAVMRVLLVEDNDMISRVTQKLLGRFGCTTTPLTDGRVAWDRLRSGVGDFDLVITDLNMPGMSGIDFLHAARNAGYAGRIIVISGLLTADVQAKLNGAKVDVFLKKPFELDDLRAAVAQCRN